jgi:putative ABC transport system ATP-binding protein
MIKKEKELIKLKNVSKIYKRNEANPVHALRSVDLKVNKGDFVAVMGPSGSGKSTCMNMIGSLDTPSHGKIYLDGKDISELEESDLAQIRGKKIGFIFQQFNLIPNLTAKENVMLPMMFQGTNKEQRVEDAEKLLKMVELGDRMNHYPNQLSGGQQQRVAIARALANDPEVVLADEPTGNLDTKTGDTVMNFLKKLHEKGKTIIMVTHEQELAEKNAPIIYWLVDGKIKKVIRKNKKRRRRTKNTRKKRNKKGKKK